MGEVVSQGGGGKEEEKEGSKLQWSGDFRHYKALYKNVFHIFCLRRAQLPNLRPIPYDEPSSTEKYSSEKDFYSTYALYDEPS